jgi:hypothetical protein
MQARGPGRANWCAHTHGNQKQKQKTRTCLARAKPNNREMKSRQQDLAAAMKIFEQKEPVTEMNQAEKRRCAQAGLLRSNWWGNEK